MTFDLMRRTTTLRVNETAVSAEWSEAWLVRQSGLRIYIICRSTRSWQIIYFGNKSARRSSVDPPLRCAGIHLDSVGRLRT